MKKFLAVFTGSASNRQSKGWNDLSDSERERKTQLGMTAWGEWMQTHAQHIVDIGGPLGATKIVNNDGVADHANALTGYVVIEASSHEAAAQLFINHPHFSIFPGDGVEVIECLELTA